jgi:tetratricopeptide (TPR) repeat protein
VMKQKSVGVLAISILAFSMLRAQDANMVADNIEFSREFYSGVHFSAISESAPSFAYQRYPDSGPERIQCDQGTFARQHGKPWLKSEDWGESGRPTDKQTAAKLDGWVKLVEAVFNFAPSEVKLLRKSRERVSVEWTFEARAANQTGAPVHLTFARPLYDKNQNALLHDFDGSLPGVGGKTGRAARVKFSFGYLIATSGFELSEAAWEDLETPKELENKPTDLSKFDMGPKPKDADGFLNRGSARGFNGDMNGAIADFSRAIELDPKSVSANYRRGITKLQKGDYDGAIGDLTRTIELSPNTADYYNDRGLAKLRKGDNDGAIGDFTRTIDLDAKNAIAYRNRALAKNIKHDADGALADLNRAIELDPKNAAAFNSRGAIKKSKGDLDGAIADFTSAIELNDKLATAYKNRGEAKQAKGDAAGAKEDLKRAGELDPGLMSEKPSVNSKQTAASATPASEEADENLVNRGIEKAKKGDLDGAIADFDRAAELNPQDDAPYYNRAQAKRLKNDTAGAIADYTRAIELGSTNPAAYNNRGNARAENNDQDGAIADYTHAIKLKPDYARAYYNRAMVKKAKGDKAGAAADFKRAKKLDPKLASEQSAAEPKNESDVDLVERAIEKGQKGDLDGALADLNRAIELGPKNSAAYYNRAGIKLLKKDTAGAIADYTHVIELDPKNVDAYNNRGILKARTNDPDGAVADYNRAIELDPKSAKAYNNRGNVKKRKGDLDGAIADFTSAIELDPKLAIAYKNRGEARQAKGDATGADADFKSADKSTLDDSKGKAVTVSLLDGKLKLDIPPDFSRDPDDPKEPKTIAKFSGPDGAWGTVLRGTHGLTPDQLDGYLKMRVSEYNKGFKWLPKDSHLQWLKKDIVTIDGRKWADWSFVPVMQGKKDYSHNPVYTRNLTTSYKGQLLELNFTTNLNTDPKLKHEIEGIMDSVHLEE